MAEKLKISDWAEEDRPREKLLAKGTQSLSNAELIAILIGSGNTDESAVDLSKRILNAMSNNLNTLGRCHADDLTKRFKGIGKAKAISIVAALELGRRRKMEEILDKKHISSSRDAFGIFQPLLCDLPHEEFWILLLNRSNGIIEKIKTSHGGVAGTIADVRIIMKHAIAKLASTLILCHNHPSGNASPSRSDDKITDKLKRACTFFDMKLADHIIIANSRYYSYADEGKL